MPPNACTSRKPNSKGCELASRPHSESSTSSAKHTWLRKSFGRSATEPRQLRALNLDEPEEAEDTEDDNQLEEAVPFLHPEEGDSS